MVSPACMAPVDVNPLTEKLEMIAFEAECLIHVLQQASRRRDENVHSGQSLLLVLEVLAANDETSRELVVATDLAEHLEDLYSLRGRAHSVSTMTNRTIKRAYQFSGRRDHKRSESVLRSPSFPQEHLEDRDQEGERLSASSSCSTKHILALEGERQCSLLDVGHARVVCRLEPSESLLRQRQIAELFGACAILAGVASQYGRLALLVRPCRERRETYEFVDCPLQLLERSPFELLLLTATRRLCFRLPLVCACWC